MDHGGWVAILWLPLAAAASNCQVESLASGPGVALTRHLGAGCTEQEREARAVDAAQLMQAFKEGKGIDLSGVIIRGDLALDKLPVGSLPPEFEGMKELQGRELRVISGSVTIVDSVVRGMIRHGSPQGFLVVQGPVTFSGTTFEQPVDLSRTVFTQPVTLSGARFLRESYFVQGRFLRDVFAEHTSFGPHTRFHRSVFQGPVTFQQSRFNGLAEFLEVVFEKDVNLSRTYFKLGTGFSGSRFQGLADFSEASFELRCVFYLYSVRRGRRLSPCHVPIDGGFFRCVVQATRRFFQSRRSKRVHSLPERPDRRPDRRPQESENQTIQYAIILSLLVLGALLIAYLIRLR